MKVKRFEHITENANNDTTFYVFTYPRHEKNYVGSIWNSPEIKWVPYSAKLVGEFSVSSDDAYMVVTQTELNRINKEKEDIAAEKDAKKYNL